MTVAQALQRQLDKKGWTQQELADKLEVSRYSVNQLLNNRRRLTATMALRLEDVLDIDATAWMRLQALQDLEEARSS